jgi:hypothetical protein
MMLQAHALSICPEHPALHCSKQMRVAMPRTDGRTEKDGEHTHLVEISNVSKRARENRHFITFGIAGADAPGSGASQ